MLKLVNTGTTFYFKYWSTKSTRNGFYFWL